MARRRKSSTRRRKKKTKAQRRRIALRNLAKAHRARRRKGGKKRRRGKKSRKRGGRRSRRRSSHRRSGGLSFKAAQVYQTLINRGRTPQQAHKVASRIDRMRTGRVKRYFEREAMQAKTSAQLGNLFSGFGAAGHLAAQVK